MTIAEHENFMAHAAPYIEEQVDELIISHPETLVRYGVAHLRKEIIGQLTAACAITDLKTRLADATRKPTLTAVESTPIVSMNRSARAR